MTPVLVILALAGILLAALAAYSQVLRARAEARFPPLGEIRAVDGVRLHYVDHVPPGWQAGDPVLVFVHGASGNLRDPRMAFFDALSQRHRLVFVDRPGHGHSERGGGEAHSPERQADLILGLMRALKLRDTVAVGHSWGGSVIAQMGLKAPELVRGLVFVAPATHPWPGGVNWYYDLAALPVIGPLFTHTLAPPVAALVAPAAISNVFLPEAAPDNYDTRIALPLLFRPDNFLANARDVARLKPEVAEAAPRYGEIRQPAAVITGDEDTVVYPDIHSAGLVRDLPNAWRVDLEGAGHMPHHTRTARVVREIEAVIAATRSRRAGTEALGRTTPDDAPVSGMQDARGG